MARSTGKSFKDPAHDQLALQVLRQFRLVYGSVRRHFREVEKVCGVSGSQAWILRELAATPEVSVGVLAERLSIHQSTCSLLVDKLVRAKCVQKTQPAADRRRVGLKLTKKGLKAVSRTPRPPEGALPKALSGLPDSTLRALHANLGRLIRGLETARVTDADKPLSEL